MKFYVIFTKKSCIYISYQLAGKWALIQFFVGRLLLSNLKSIRLNVWFCEVQFKLHNILHRQCTMKHEMKFLYNFFFTWWDNWFEHTTIPLRLFNYITCSPVTLFRSVGVTVANLHHMLSNSTKFTWIHFGS